MMVSPACARHGLTRFRPRREDGWAVSASRDTLPGRPWARESTLAVAFPVTTMSARGRRRKPRASSLGTETVCLRVSDARGLAVSMPGMTMSEFPLMKIAMPRDDLR